MIVMSAIETPIAVKNTPITVKTMPQGSNPRARR